MEVNDIDKGSLIMTNENRKIFFTISVASVLFEIVYLYYLYSAINKPLFKGDLWYDILLSAPLILFLFTTILGLISYYKRGIKYYENGIFIHTGIMKKEFIKYFDIEYIMIPERTTKQYLWHGDITPKIKIKYQDKFVRIWKISKNASKFLESKCQIKTFQGKYQIETDASRSEQAGRAGQRRSERLGEVGCPTSRPARERRPRSCEGLTRATTSPTSLWGGW